MSEECNFVIDSMREAAAALRGSTWPAGELEGDEQSAGVPTDDSGDAWTSPLAAHDSPFWMEERRKHVAVMDAAVAAVERHVLSVRCQDGDLRDVAAVGARTFVTTVGRPVLLHVWIDRRECRRFHEAFRRVTQTLFEHMIPAPFKSTTVALVGFQG